MERSLIKGVLFLEEPLRKKGMPLQALPRGTAPVIFAREGVLISSKMYSSSAESAPLSTDQHISNWRMQRYK